jgi:hypothetical protein
MRSFNAATRPAVRGRSALGNQCADSSPTRAPQAVHHALQVTPGTALRRRAGSAPMARLACQSWPAWPRPGRPRSGHPCSVICCSSQATTRRGAAQLVQQSMVVAGQPVPPVAVAQQQAQRQVGRGRWARGRVAQRRGRESGAGAARALGQCAARWCRQQPAHRATGPTIPAAPARASSGSSWRLSAPSGSAPQRAGLRQHAGERPSAVARSHLRRPVRSAGATAARPG